MKIFPTLLLLSVVAAPLAAQEAPPEVLQEAPPPGLVEVENARSRACVPALARLAELNRALEPLARRAERLRVINEAIALEDSTVAAPFHVEDATEKAARDWFVSDATLARRFVETGESALQDQRRTAKAGIRAQLTMEMDSVRAGADARMGDAEEIRAAAQPCEGAVLVRPAVIEACRTGSGPVCDAARSDSVPGRFRFVEEAQDLWDIEEIRPWSEPGPLRVGPDGSLVGARTAARARLGNVAVILGVAPIIRERAELPEAEVAAFDANLDTLGVDFSHPDLVMAPAIELQANVPPPIDGETDYLLHFGDLSGEDDVIWRAPTGAGGVVRASFPAKGQDLRRLAAGASISFTAIRIEGEGETAKAEAVYSLTLTPVNQAPAVNGLLAYILDGGLSRDLTMLAPPGR